MSEIKTPQIGSPVIYTTERGVDCPALVTAVWGNNACAINVVFVSPDENEKDGYGRQIKRESSVCHASVMHVHGRLWRHIDEPKPEYVAPSAV